MQTEEDLWKAGYQTQSSVQKSVAISTGKTEAEATNFLNEKQKEAIQQQQDKLNQIKNKANNYQEQYNQAKGQLDELKNTKLPSFKATPMVMRWKPIYQFNVRGQNILTKNNQMVVNLGIEHSINRNFSQGFGLYNNIDFSLRKPYTARWGQSYIAYYLNYKIIAGLHLQAGYEYNIINTHNNNELRGENNWMEHLTKNQNNIAYIGIQKRYRINNKWQGNIMIGYDYLYHGPTTIKNTPWIIRIGINK